MINASVSVAVNGQQLELPALAQLASVISHVTCPG